MQMARPLISVITPTWQRAPRELIRCLESVKAQSWDRWEHVVVSDGPDPEFAPVAAAWQDGRHRFAELPYHDTFFRWGVRARLQGLEICSGDVVAWLDDDNAFRPDHLEALYGHMASLDTDWAYSQALFHAHGSEYVVGAAPPVLGQLDTSVMMSSRAAYDVATWRDDGQQTIDWDLAERWIASGLSYAFLPQITVDYYVRLPQPPGVRMADWSITMAGDCHPDQLDQLQADVAAAVAPYGLSASQVATARHNGPLPAPVKKGGRGSKNEE